jgi:sorting nexin-3/12
MPGTIAPSSGHSPFARAALPSSTSFNSSFPSTSLFSGGGSSPYVTDQQPPLCESAFNKTPQQGEPRGQTLEEMYSAPENTLEIEVREPRTQGEFLLCC